MAQLSLENLSAAVVQRIGHFSGLSGGANPDELGYVSPATRRASTLGEGLDELGEPQVTCTSAWLEKNGSGVAVDDCLVEIEERTYVVSLGCAFDSI